VDRIGSMRQAARLQDIYAEVGLVDQDLEIMIRYLLLRCAARGIVARILKANLPFSHFLVIPCRSLAPNNSRFRFDDIARCDGRQDASTRILVTPASCCALLTAYADVVLVHAVVVLRALRTDCFELGGMVRGALAVSCALLTAAASRRLADKARGDVAEEETQRRETSSNYDQVGFNQTVYLCQL
jgi:hypothetical protein